jgi:hypothetical protein
MQENMHIVDIQFTWCPQDLEKKGLLVDACLSGLDSGANPSTRWTVPTAHMMGADLASVSADRADRETINLPGIAMKSTFSFPERWQRHGKPCATAAEAFPSASSRSPDARRTADPRRR